MTLTLKPLSIGAIFGLAIALVGAVPAHAQELVADSGDTSWTLAGAVMALLLIVPGIGLFWGSRFASGDYRGPMGKLAPAMLGALALISLLWIGIGYSLSFSPTGGRFLGDGFNWMLNNLSMVRGDTTVAESAFVLLQLMLAALAGLIAISAVAPRANPAWTTGFAGLWSLFVYAPIAYWVWGTGWLADIGVVDGAGGLVVQASAGISALIAWVVVGGGPSDAADTLESTDMSFAMWPPFIGIALVWTGWLALTGSMELGATDDAAMAMLNAHISASIGALLWAVLGRFDKDRTAIAERRGQSIATGALAGLVAASATAGFVSPGGAVLTGLAGSLVAWVLVRLLANRFAGTPAGTIAAVHAGAGIAGALAGAIFIAANLGGTGYDEGMTMGGQVIAQTIAAGVILLWSVVGTLIVGYGVSIIFKPSDGV